MEFRKRRHNTRNNRVTITSSIRMKNLKNFYIEVHLLTVKPHWKSCANRFCFDMSKCPFLVLAEPKFAEMHEKREKYFGKSAM